MISRTTISLAGALAASVALAALPAHSAGSTLARPDAQRLASPAPARINDAVLTQSPPARVLRSTAWIGGAHTTSTGETVTVYASDAFEPGIVSTAAWAEFFASLYHGPELSRVRIYIATRAEVQALCGSVGIVACYDPRSEQLYTPGDRREFLQLEHVAAHEYGHHVANNRVNAPWRAGEWGTKRWATYEGVCPLAAQGVVFPGDQGENYERNPGESFAEAYGLLNAQRFGTWNLMPWDFAEFFYPDAAAFAAIQQDVLRPWTRWTIVRWRASVRRARATVSRRIVTPLDGSLAIRVAGAFRGSVSVADARTGRVLVRRAGRSAVATVCGQRSIRIRLTAARAGRFTVSVARP